MAFRRATWDSVFRKDDIPKYPCPSCADGRLLPVEDGSFLEEPKYSVDGQRHEDFEPDWTTERFSERLRCDHAACGEICIVAGDTTLIEVYDDDFGWGLITVFRPQTFFPAPSIIGLPSNAPSKVLSEIRTAFGLFWSDVGSAGNRLRTSVEYLLDDLQVPRQIMSKKNVLVDLDLNGRIQAFQKTDPDHARTFDALRMVGNLGSHTSDLSRDAFLDAMELYEDALVELYGLRKARLDALKEKIIKSKGKY